MSADNYGVTQVFRSLLPAVRRIARVAGVAAVPMVFGACEWFSDFKEQPKLESWESYSFANSGQDSMNTDTIPMRGQPQGSIPMSGLTAALLVRTVARFRWSWWTVSMSTLVTPMTAASRLSPTF